MKTKMYMNKSESKIFKETSTTVLRTGKEGQRGKPFTCEINVFFPTRMPLRWSKGIQLKTSLNHASRISKEKKIIELFQ